MQNRERLSRRVGFVPAGHLESHMLVIGKLVRSLVYIHFVDVFLVDGVLHEPFSVSLTLLVGTDKQHLDEFIAQSHKGGNFFFFVADDVKLYGKKVLLSSYQRFVKLYILFCQEVMCAADRGFPDGQQFVIILWGRSNIIIYCITLLVINQ